MSESFAALFEESLKRSEMRTGEVITAEVVRIEHNHVVVNAGLKSEAYVPIEEFKNDQGELEVHAGDFVSVAIEALDIFLKVPDRENKAKDKILLNHVTFKAQPGDLIALMGPSGAGQITKMTNQICVVGLCQALAEGLDFAETAGLDVKRVIHVMLQGSSASWQMANRAEKMLDGQYDYGFSTTLMRKDIGLVLDEATAMNVPLPVTSMVGQMLAEVTAMGGAQWDWCSLMERQRRRRT